MFEVKMEPSGKDDGVNCTISISNLSQSDLVGYIGIMLHRLYDTVFDTNPKAAKLLRAQILAMLASKDFWDGELVGDVLSKECVMFSGPDSMKL